MARRRVDGPGRMYGTKKGGHIRRVQCTHTLDEHAIQHGINLPNMAPMNIYLKINFNRKLIARIQGKSDGLNRPHACEYTTCVHEVHRFTCTCTHNMLSNSTCMHIHDTVLCQCTTVYMAQFCVSLLLNDDTRYYHA